MCAGMFEALSSRFSVSIYSSNVCEKSVFAWKLKEWRSKNDFHIIIYLGMVPRSPSWNVRKNAKRVRISFQTINIECSVTIHWWGLVSIAYLWTFHRLISITLLFELSMGLAITFFRIDFEWTERNLCHPFHAFFLPENIVELR